MRIAFDVKGTIDGPKGKFVLGLMAYLQELGHECVVWSNSLQFAAEAVNKNKLKVEFMSKRMGMDLDHDETQFFDFAVEDDTSQTWLAAKSFIWVHELPGAMGGIKKLAEEIHSGHYKGNQKETRVRG